MKFGIFNFGSWHESVSSHQIIDDLVEEAVLADSLGYDDYWIGEHHFSRHGIFGNALLLAANVAGQTEKIRIGTAVVILPLHDPVRIAEEVALVDILSKGRLNLGVGSGYQRLEFKNMHVDINEARERFAEALDVLDAVWSSDEEFSFQGKFRSWDADQHLMVLPTVYQRPHPPIYIAVSASPETIDLAAKRGHRLLLGGPSDLLGIAPQMIQRWQDGMIANGHDPTGIDIPCAKGIYCAPTDEEANADLAEVDTLWDLKLLVQIGSPLSPEGEIPPGYKAWDVGGGRDRRKALEAAQNGDTAATARLVGSPDTVSAHIAELQDMGITSIFGQHGFPAMPHWKVKRSMELFGREVMPRFKSLASI